MVVAGWPDVCDDPPRMAALGDLIHYYDPDLIALQEVTPALNHILVLRFGRRNTVTVLIMRH